MVKSKGVGRGGRRPGAGRRPAPKPVDWNKVADRYFRAGATIAMICSEFGITEADLSRHADLHGWVRRQEKLHPDDVGRLGGQLALSMISIDGVSKRARCFVAAMVRLEAPISEIAETLEVSEASLRAEFSRELQGYGR